MRSIRVIRHITASSSSAQQRIAAIPLPSVSYGHRCITHAVAQPSCVASSNETLITSWRTRASLWLPSSNTVNVRRHMSTTLSLPSLSTSTIPSPSSTAQSQAASPSLTTAASAPAGEQTTSRPVVSETVIALNELIQIIFTCKPCSTRSAHHMNRRAYREGVVLIQCPGCKNNHLIADHLGWFEDNRTTVEDMLRARGEKVISGTGGASTGDALLQLSPDDIARIAALKPRTRKIVREDVTPVDHMHSTSSTPSATAPLTPRLPRKGQNSTTSSSASSSSTSQ